MEEIRAPRSDPYQQRRSALQPIFQKLLRARELPLLASHKVNVMNKQYDMGWYGLDLFISLIDIRGFKTSDD